MISGDLAQAAYRPAAAEIAFARDWSRNAELHPLSLRFFCLWGLALAALITVTRWPLRSRYLFSWDSANFAQALDAYNVAFHRPHPPGYPLYVAAAWLVRLVVHDANTAYVLLSMGASIVASVLLLGLAWRLGGGLPAVLATGLFVSSPNTWGHGEVAYPYAFLAVGAVAVAWCAVETRLGRHDLTLQGAAVLGVAGGFRPDLVPFLLPLWLWGSYRGGVRRVVAGGLLLAMIVALWLVPMVALSGGWSAYAKTLTDYAEVWGTPIDAGSVAFVVGVGRNVAELAGFGARSVGPVWGFLLLLAAGRVFSPWRVVASPQLRCLLLWIAPPVLFYVLVHIGNLGYLLSVLPALAVVAALTAIELGEEIRLLFPPIRIAGSGAASAAAVGIIAVSCVTEISMFLLSRGPVSLAEIRDVDMRLSVTLPYLTADDPNTTLVLAYDGFAQFQYYLGALDAQQHIRSVNDLLGPDTRPTNRRDIVVPQGIELVVLADLDQDMADRPTGLGRVNLGHGIRLYEGGVHPGDSVRVGYGFARIYRPGAQAAADSPAAR